MAKCKKCGKEPCACKKDMKVSKMAGPKGKMMKIAGYKKGRKAC